MKYQLIVSEVLSTPWAIMPEKLGAIMGFLRFKAEGGEVSAEDVAMVKQEARPPVYFLAGDEPSAEAIAAIDEGTSPPIRLGHGLSAEEMKAALSSMDKTSRSRAGAIAVLPLVGTITQRAGMMSNFSGGTSTEKFSQMFRGAMNDPDIRAIVIDVDSPGGTVNGVIELGDEIFKARGQKPVVAVANSLAASAAYWLATQAPEMVATPGAQVGSVGVFGAHEDVSKAAEMAGVKVTLISAGKYKTEGNEWEPLSDAAREDLQSKVDQFYEMFVKAVARGRGVSANDVKNGFGEGRTVTAKDAAASKMVDRVATMSQTLTRLGATPSKAVLAAEGQAIRITEVQEQPSDPAAPKSKSNAMRERELTLHR